MRNKKPREISGAISSNNISSKTDSSQGTLQNDHHSTPALKKNEKFNKTIKLITHSSITAITDHDTKAFSNQQKEKTEVSHCIHIVPYFLAPKIANPWLQNLYHLISLQHQKLHFIHHAQQKNKKRSSVDQKCKQMKLVVSNSPKLLHNSPDPDQMRSKNNQNTRETHKLKEEARNHSNRVQHNNFREQFD